MTQKANTKKRLVLIILAFLIIIFIILLFLKNNLKQNSANNKIDLNMFALMIEQEDGTYQEISDNNWPGDGYIYNAEKSVCMDADGNEMYNSIIYNQDTKKIKVKAKKAAYCYLYFSLVNGDIYIKVNTDGANGITPDLLGYKKTITCDSGSTNWNYKYNRLEIEGINKIPTVCNLNYTKDSTSYTSLRSKVESVATNEGTAGYRYKGKNPDNYIWFNNEMWRIIGSIPTKVDSSGTSENLVKIIRNNSIGGLAYDAKASSYTGEWGSNTLYTLLNNYYWGKQDATDTSYCYSQKNRSPAKCNYKVIGLSNEDNYGSMVKNVYWNTGQNAYRATAIDAYNYEITNQTVKGHVGLMSSSDYGFATTSAYSEEWLLNFEGSPASNNWLFKESQEFTSTYGYTGDPDTIDYYGECFPYAAYAGNSVRPVVYLDSSVYIIDGTGTESDPFIIAMN